MVRNLLCVLALCGTVCAEDWPCFRGPSRQGISLERGVPLRWSAREGVAWSVAVPGEGWSSPIVKNGRVFVTTTTEEGVSCRVLAFDAASGKPLWEREVFRQKPGRKEARNGYATPTPVADAESVYAVFGDGSVAALTHGGEQVWTNREFPYYSQHGMGGSPLLYDGLLIMARDGSYTGENNEDLRVGWQIPWERSFLLALDAKTGKLRWKTMRGNSRIGHVTPNLMEVDGRMQLVSGAGDVVQGYDPRTGKQLWNTRSQGEGAVPSVVTGGGLIYTCSGFEKPAIRTLKADGSVAWEQTRGVPMISSLLYADPYVYSVTTNGVAWCFRAATGEPVWQGRLGGNYSASPVLADGRIYFTSDEGETVVVRHGAEFEELARNALGERVQASPAVAEGRIYIRTALRLYCFSAAGRQ